MFGEALRLEPQAKISWVARAISRGQQNKFDQAAGDFNYAATLYAQDGDEANARRLRQAMERRGFQAFATEWWHFDWHDWQRLPVVE